MGPALLLVLGALLLWLVFTGRARAVLTAIIGGSQ